MVENLMKGREAMTDKSKENMAESKQKVELQDLEPQEAKAEEVKGGPQYSIPGG